MHNGRCQDDLSWTKELNASVSMSLYQRTATVAYDKSNFSILSIESIGDPVNATTQNLVSDFKRMCEIMFPQVSDLVSAFLGSLTSPDTILQDLQDFGSVYCVQSELFSTMWILQKGFPTWAAGPRDILEGFLAIPIQFGTVLWQFANITSLPSNMHTTASSAQVSYRARSEPWTLITFAAITGALILWAIFCLLYAHCMSNAKINAQFSPTIEAAFKSGNPFDIKTASIGESLRGCLGWMCPGTSPASQSTADANAKGEVFARTLNNGVMIAIDRSEILTKENSDVDW